MSSSASVRLPVHLLHLVLQRLYPPLLINCIAEGIYLVYETAHTGCLFKSTFKMGEFHVVVGIGKSRAEDSAVELGILALS